MQCDIACDKKDIASVKNPDVGGLGKSKVNLVLPHPGKSSKFSAAASESVPNQTN